MPEERSFRLRPRRPRRQMKDESKAWSKAFKGLMHIARMTTKPSAARRKRGSFGGGSRHSAIRQRCAIRVTYSPNRIRGQWAAHGRYIMRESATRGDGSRGAGFTTTGEGVDIAKTLDGWQKSGDPRLFKLIVSPEFGERVDLRRHVRDLMARMELDLAVPLEWVAVEHFNTGHPHVHIALRGVAGDRPLRIDRAYIKHGIRKHAEDLCTAQLGFRTQADALEVERREIDQPRFTSLDKTISRSRTDPTQPFLVELNTTTNGSEFHRSRQHHIAARLRTLQTMGLADPAGPQAWIVNADFDVALRAMQRQKHALRLNLHRTEEPVHTNSISAKGPNRPPRQR